jgi:hypothetical protein
MVEELPDPISRELHDAFGAAICAYRDWGRGQAKPEVSYNQEPFAISFVCDLVIRFKETSGAFLQPRRAAPMNC